MMDKATPKLLSKIGVFFCRRVHSTVTGFTSKRDTAQTETRFPSNLIPLPLALRDSSSSKSFNEAINHFYGSSEGKSIDWKWEKLQGIDEILFINPRLDRATSGQPLDRQDNILHVYWKSRGDDEWIKDAMLVSFTELTWRVFNYNSAGIYSDWNKGLIMTLLAEMGLRRSRGKQFQEYL